MDFPRADFGRAAQIVERVGDARPGEPEAVHRGEHGMRRPDAEQGGLPDHDDLGSVHDEGTDGGGEGLRRVHDDQTVRRQPCGEVLDRVRRDDEAVLVRARQLHDRQVAFARRRGRARHAAQIEILGDVVPNRERPSPGEIRVDHVARTARGQPFGQVHRDRGRADPALGADDDEDAQAHRAVPSAIRSPSMSITRCAPRATVLAGACACPTAGCAVAATCGTIAGAPAPARSGTPSVNGSAG